MDRRLIIVIMAGMLAFTAACSKQDSAPSAGSTASAQEDEMAAEADTAGSAASMEGTPGEEAENASSGLRKESRQDGSKRGTSDGQDPASNQASQDREKNAQDQKKSSQGQEKSSQGQEKSSQDQKTSSQGQNKPSQEQQKASQDQKKAERSGGPSPEEEVVPDEEINGQQTETPSSAEYDAGGQEGGRSGNEGIDVPLD